MTITYRAGLVVPFVKSQPPLAIPNDGRPLRDVNKRMGGENLASQRVWPIY